MNLNTHSNVVPWITPEQFKQVYKGLYSENILEKRWAVDQISVWETRCHPALPTAIEATAALVRADIQNMLFVAGNSICQEEEVRMLYAMALVRFVNLIVEIDQNAQSKIRMSVLAEKKNIPSWVVELRHAATHATCPSLAVLQMAARDNLRYLEDTYWRQEGRNIRPVLKRPPDHSHKMAAAVHSYRRIQHSRMDRMIDKKNLQKETKLIMKEIRYYLRKFGKEFVRVLVQPGAFISLDDVHKIMEKGLDQSFFESHRYLYLPILLERMWSPMIRLLHFFDLVPLFLELLLRQPLSIKASQKLKTAWAIRILEVTTVYNPERESPIGRCFAEKNPIFNLHRVFYSCMMGSDIFTFHLLDRILLKMENFGIYRELAKLSAIYQGFTLEGSKKLELLYHAENLEEDLFYERKRKRTDPEEDEDQNIWSLAPLNMDFSQIPNFAVINPVTKEPVVAEDKLSIAIEDCRTVDITEEITEVENTCNFMSLIDFPVAYAKRQKVL